MKHRFFILLIVLIGISCSHNTSNKKTTLDTNNDLLEYNLNGNVKEISITKYNAKDSFGIVLKDGIYKNDYDSLSDKEETIFFNKDGYITRKIKYNNGVIVSKTDFKVDSLGKKIEKNEFNSKNKLTSKQVFKYNKNGKVREMSSYLNNGEIQMKWVYVYEGNKVTRNNYYSSGSKFSSYIKTYDENDELIKLEYLDYENSKNNYIYNYSYNDKENTVIQTNKSFYSPNLNDTKWLRKYNDQGVLIEETMNDYSTTKYHYEYDNHNNWTKQIQISLEFPRYIIERKIGYFE